jgi:hypothetical protein
VWQKVPNVLLVLADLFACGLMTFATLWESGFWLSNIAAITVKEFSVTVCREN